MTNTVNPTKDLDNHIVRLLTKISEMREQSHNRGISHGGHGHIGHPINNNSRQMRKAPMSNEARSLELWRAVAVECLATFIFALIVSGASFTSGSSFSLGPSFNSLKSSYAGSDNLVILSTAIATGLSVAAINLIFGHVSG